MGERPTFKPDEIGAWSEIKLDIVRDYASAYSKILAAQSGLSHLYIDAFAEAGTHISKATRELIPGSPANALLVKPPFCEYHLIDLDASKVAELKALKANRSDVFIYQSDCNPILLDSVFPRTRYEDYRRALCLLDPYGLDLNWKVIETAGQMRSVEIFLNFPVMDMNRNVLWGKHEAVPLRQIERMSSYWGDDSWKQAAYRTQRDLFGEETLEKQHISQVIKAFRQRLKKVAGFHYVPEPLPMWDKGHLLYYLFFASQKPVAQRIVEDIFKKYRGREAH